MTPEIRECYNRMIDAAPWVGVAVTTAGGADELRQFIAKARPYANGTLDAILPHFMSISDMTASQQNLTKAIKVAEHLLALNDLLATPVECEIA